MTIKAIQAQVRPIFQSNGAEPAKFKGFSRTYTSNTNTTDNVRPPSGSLWQVSLLQMKITAQTGGPATTFTIYLNSGGTTYVLDTSSTNAVGTTIDFTSFGNGPLVLSNSNYAQFYVTTTAAGSSISVEMIAVYEEIS